MRLSPFISALAAALAILTAIPSTASAAPITFSYTGAIVQYVVPVAGIYNVMAYGAAGGGNNPLMIVSSYNAPGAIIGGDIILNAGDLLHIAAGGLGSTRNTYWYFEGGGGGGTFVVLEAAGIFTPLVIAGGGGGGLLRDDLTYHSGGRGLAGTSGGSGETNSGLCTPGPGGNGGNGGGPAVCLFETYGGGGGGGYLTDGADIVVGPENYPGGASFFNGLVGSGSDRGRGIAGAEGGFGGGGGSSNSGDGGGGGGYSGGSGGAGQGHRAIPGAPGGGGGSYIIDRPSFLLADDVAISGASDRFAAPQGNYGYGYVTLDYVREVPEPFTLSLFGSGVAGMVAIQRRKKKAA